MTDTSQTNVMKRLKDNGLTPVKISLASSFSMTRAKPEKKNQVTATSVSKLNEKMQQAKKKKGLQQDVDFSFLRGNKVKYEIAPRRAGDSAICYANCDKANKEIGFSAQKTLKDACESAYNYEIKKLEN